MSPKALLVDGGQTGTRLGVPEPGGTRIVAEGPGVAPLALPDGPQRLARDLSELCRDAGFSPGRDTILVAGLSGLGEVWHRCQELCDALHAQLGSNEVVVASDIVSSHLGALDGGAGIVAAIGTGSVVLGIDVDGTAVKADGWGHLLGDGGSGFAIGRAGLRAALAHHDGRGGSAALAMAAAARFGPLEQLAGRILADPARVRTVASFTRSVADVARDGDAVAAAIWQEAVREVTASIVAVARRLGARADGRVVSWAGSLLELDELLRTPVRAAVADAGVDLRWEPPRGSAIDGAAALLRGEVRTRVAQLVHSSTSGD